MIVATLVAGALSLGPAGSAHAAQVLKDVWGVVTDPLKLERTSQEISGTVDRTLMQLRELERQVNLDATARLEQIAKIVADVLQAADKNVANIDAIVTNALGQLKQIEKDVYEDAVRLIFRAQCAAETVAMDTLQRSLAELISNLIAADPGVDIRGIRVVDLSLKKIEITDPDLAYLSTKKQYLKKLSATKADDPAFFILSGYQNIARFANFAQCHYIDQSLAIRFIEERNEFERLSAPWLSVVRPSL